MLPFTFHDLDGQLLLSKASLSRNTDSLLVQPGKPTGLYRSQESTPGRVGQLTVLEMGEAYLKDEKSPVSYFPVGGGVGIQPSGRGGVAAIVAVVGLVSGAVIGAV